MASTVTPPWAIESSELPAVKSNARYAGSKAATSSAKDIIFASTLSEEAAGHTGKRVHYAQEKDGECPFATDAGASSPSKSKRAPLRGDVGDKFSVGSSKVGSVQLDSAVYVQNLADSRARLASAKAANFKGEGALRQEEHA